MAGNGEWVLEINRMVASYDSADERTRDSER